MHSLSDAEKTAEFLFRRPLHHFIEFFAQPFNDPFLQT